MNAHMKAYPRSLRASMHKLLCGQDRSQWKVRILSRIRSGKVFWTQVSFPDSSSDTHDYRDRHPLGKTRFSGHRKGQAITDLPSGHRPKHIIRCGRSRCNGKQKSPEDRLYICTGPKRKRSFRTTTTIKKAALKAAISERNHPSR